MIRVTRIKHQVFYSCSVQLPRLISARVLLPLLAVVCLTAQTQPVKSAPLTVQGSFRTRIEAWDWFEGSADNSYAFSGNLLRLTLGQQRKQIDWQLELAAPFLLGLPENAIAPAPQGQFGLGASYYAANDAKRNAGMVFAKQAFVRFKGLFGDPRQSLRLGRFEFIDGSEVAPRNPTLAALKRDRIAHRLLGNFGFSHVGRSYDGIQYGNNRPKVNYTILAAMPTRGVFQVDGWGNLKTGLVYAAATGQVAGKKSSGEWRVLGLYYHDWRRVLKTDNRPLATRRSDTGNIRIGTLGGHYLHAWETPSGTVDILLWGVLQVGRWGVLDHRSGALSTEAGWQPKAVPALKPWLRAGFFHGHGDGDPNDTTHGTFFQVLPTPRIYARFPFFNLMNSEDLFGSVTLRPHKTVSIKTEVHGLRLASRNDLWLLGGGAFQPWTFGYVGRPSNGKRGLANLYDASIDWLVSPVATLSAYYGYATGGAVIEKIYPNGKNGSLGYLELSYRF